MLLACATTYGFLGVYGPSYSSDEDVLDYEYTRGAEAGNLTLLLMNLRADLQFRYWHVYGTDQYCLAGVSNSLSISTSTVQQPVQVHLALTAHPTEMRVQVTHTYSQILYTNTHSGWRM